MTEPEPTLASGIYKPFPSFADWELSGGLDTGDFDRYAELLGRAKQAASPANLDAAIVAATRYAAIDTGAIEGLYSVDRGFTRTIATQAASWEAVMESRGPQIRPAFHDAMNGYEYVLDAATNLAQVSEIWIKELHSIICASQDTFTVFTSSGPQDRPLIKGAYKTIPNSPTLLDGRVHAYAPVIDTIPEMQRLINELRSEGFMSAHPILQASYAHYAYVCIHPFPDGNGRIARALSSIYLYRSPGIPLIVFADQRNEYYDALESADNGDSFPFIQFVAAKAIDAIGIIRLTLQRNAPPIESTIAGLTRLFGSGATDLELQAAAVRLRNLAVAEGKKQLAAFSLPPQLKLRILAGLIEQVQPPPGYATVGNDGSWYMLAQSSWPRTIQVFHSVAVFAKASDSAASELLMASKNEDSGLEVWLREIVPAVAESLKLKLAGWVETQIAEWLAAVARKAEQT
ncbi:Fic family protein [Nocardia salmonicida]|uniref:Fic family protein n=1 Tax=Nocardia salmonicida TaxID=53431 RepID=UPI00340EDD5E